MTTLLLLFAVPSLTLMLLLPVAWIVSESSPTTALDEREHEAQETKDCQHDRL